MIQLWSVPKLHKSTFTYVEILEYSSEDGKDFKNNLESRQGNLLLADNDKEC